MQLNYTFYSENISRQNSTINVLEQRNYVVTRDDTTAKAGGGLYVLLYLISGQQGNKCVLFTKSVAEQFIPSLLSCNLQSTLCPPLHRPEQANGASFVRLHFRAVYSREIHILPLAKRNEVWIGGYEQNQMTTAQLLYCQAISRLDWHECLEFVIAVVKHFKKNNFRCALHRS